MAYSEAFDGLHRFYLQWHELTGGLLGTLTPRLDASPTRFASFFAQSARLAALRAGDALIADAVSVQDEYQSIANEAAASILEHLPPRSEVWSDRWPVNQEDPYAFAEAGTVVVTWYGRLVTTSDPEHSSWRRSALAHFNAATLMSGYCATRVFDDVGEALEALER